jgi:hypothetical protein
MALAAAVSALEMVVIPRSVNSAENAYTSLKVRTESTCVHVIGSFNLICVAVGLSKAASFNLSEVYAFSALLTLRGIDYHSGTPREKCLAPLLLFGMRFQKLLHFR